MAYASTSSPFAAVKGDNLFKKSASPSPFAAVVASANASPSPSPFASKSSTPFPSQASPSLSSSTTPKRTPVFGSSSPFGASVKAKQDVLGSTSKLGRAKSPARRAAAGTGGSAFSAYATKGAQGFALAESKSAASPLLNGNGDTGSGNASGAEDEDTGAEDGDAKPNSRAATFGEKLRASKDEDAKLEEEANDTVFNEQEGKLLSNAHSLLNAYLSQVTTGEENEETVHQVRGKLFMLLEGQWKERGTGMLKINVRRDDGGGARLSAFRVLSRPLMTHRNRQ